MSALLQSYEDEFLEISAAVKKDIHSLRGSLRDGETTLGSADRATLLKTTQQSITKLKELNTNIQYESNDLSAGKREEARKNLSEYKTAVLQYEKDLTRAKGEVAAKEREELLNSGNKNDSAAPLTGGAENDVDRARLKMEDNTNKMRKGTDTLKHAEQLVNESDALADETIGSLAKQGDKIRKIKATTMDAEDEINQSKRTLNRMQKVMIQNKCMLIVIICVLLFLIFIIAYMKYSGSGNHNAGESSVGGGSGADGGDKVAVPLPPTPPAGCEPYCVAEAPSDLNMGSSSGTLTKLD